MIVNENVGESSTSFSCEKCHFYTAKKFNYDKHRLTAKHLKSMIINENVGKSSKRSTSPHICTICKKTYKEPSGLWRHKKKCQLAKNDDDSAEQIIKIDKDTTDKDTTDKNTTDKNKTDKTKTKKNI